MAIKDIADVPHSLNTGFEPVELHNPLDRDFTFRQGGVDYTIPAESTVSYPEFRAFHGAKHLAKKIAFERLEDHIKKEAHNPMNPDSSAWKKVVATVPTKKIQDIMGWLLNPEGDLPNPLKDVVVDKTNIQEPKKSYDDMTWSELRGVAHDKGFFAPGMKKAEILEKLKGE